MRSNNLIAGTLVVSAALLAGCGSAGEEAAVAPQAPALVSAAVIDGDPYTVSCGHVRDQMKWADVTRRATVAIADAERIRGLNRLQATQSVFFAMTEICEGRPASFEPADAAVRGVRDGTYRADLGTP